MKKNIFFLALLLFSSSMMAQIPQFSLSYSGNSSFNSYWITPNQSQDTISKMGMGGVHSVNASYLFLNRNPSFGSGFKLSLDISDDYFSLTSPAQNFPYRYHYIKGESTKGFLGFMMGFILSHEFNVQGYLGPVFEKGNVGINTSSSTGSNLSYQDSVFRIGGRLGADLIYSGDELQFFLKKVQFSAYADYFPKDMAIINNRWSYYASLDVNLVQVLSLGDFYLSPVLGASIKESEAFSLGVSPVVSVGIAFASSRVSTDFLKISYGRKIYWQEKIPYNGIDMLYFTFCFAIE